MFATRESLIEDAAVVPHLRGLAQDVAQVFSSSIDPELARALLERRRRGELGRDRQALQSAEDRLASLHRLFPAIEAEESDLLLAARRSLLGKVEKA